MRDYLVSCRSVKQIRERVRLLIRMKTSASLYHSRKKGVDVQMRSDLEMKVLLSEATRSVVKQGFLKRHFKDVFTEEEMIKVKEIDEFLRAVSLHRNSPMLEDTRVKYTCIIFKATYRRKNGASIECFIPRFVNQEDFDYKIPYFVAKCIYRLAQKRCIEVFFTVNSLRAVANENNKYIHFQLN